MVRFQWKLVALVLAISFILWVVTIGTTYVIQYPPDSFYYVKQLPPWYWFGIYLAGLAFLWLMLNPLAGRAKVLIELALVLILVLYLFGTPSFIYPTTRFLDTYDVSGMTDRISTAGEAGFYDPSSPHIYEAGFYTSLIWNHSLSEIGGFETLSFARYYPILMMLTVSLLLYAICQRIGTKYAIMAPIAVLGVSWVQEYHLSPQAFAFTLSIVLIFLLLFIVRSEHSYRALLLALIVWAAIVTSHPTSSILILVALVFMTVCYAWARYIHFPRDIPALRSGLVRLGPVCGLMPLLTVTFLAYVAHASTYMWSRMVGLVETIVSNVMGGERWALSRDIVVAPAQDYVDLTYIRWLVLVGTIVLGTMTVALLLRIRGNRERMLPTPDLLGKLLYKDGQNTSQVFMGMLFFGYLLVGAALVIAGYSTYGFDRSYMFAAVPFGVLASMALAHATTAGDRLAKIFDSFKVCLFMFVVASLMVIPVSRYGTDPYQFISEPQVAMMAFHEQYKTDPRPSVDMREAEKLETVYNFYVLARQQGAEYVFSREADHNVKIYDVPRNSVYLGDRPLPQEYD